MTRRSFSLFTLLSPLLAWMGKGEVNPWRDGKIHYNPPPLMPVAPKPVTWIHHSWTFKYTPPNTPMSIVTSQGQWAGEILPSGKVRWTLTPILNRVPDPA